MRRILVVAVTSLALAACATPPIRLSQSWRPGEVRTYTLRADATIAIDLPSGASTQTTSLRARSTLTVVSTDGTTTTVRLLLEPERFVVDGEARELTTQEVELIVGPDGEVQRIASVGGLPADLASNVEELAPLLGAPLPGDRVRIGYRWRRPIAPPSIDSPVPPPVGEQTGRVAALRVVDGFEAAIVTLGTERPLSREREVGGQRLSLIGTEYSASEIAFAFREGFPVRIDTDAEARLNVVSFGSSGGSAVITTTSELRLVGA